MLSKRYHFFFANPAKRSANRGNRPVPIFLLFGIIFINLINFIRSYKKRFKRCMVWLYNVEPISKMSFGLPPLAGLVPRFKSFDPPQADLRFTTHKDFRIRRGIPQRGTTHKDYKIRREVQQRWRRPLI